MKKILLVLPLMIFTLIESPAQAGGFLQFTADQEGVKVYEVIKTNSKNTFTEVPAPWKIEVKKDESRMFVFEKPGFIPVYVPVYFEPSHNIEMTVNLKRMDGETKTQMTVPALSLADELVDDIIFTQQLIEQKKYNEALVRSEALYLKHAESVSVKLLYANALFTNQQYDRADNIYAALLQEIPEDKVSMKTAVTAMREKTRTLRHPASASDHQKGGVETP